MASEEFTRNVGQFMDVYLQSQKSMTEAMGRYFSSLNIASRTDVLTLGERLTAIEEKLDALEASVTALAAANREAASATPQANTSTPRPRRTKKPPESGTE
ncbi:MAG: hypothetical protein U5Q44_14195 [Dehalococcoidia bacterium]|nr:hypothetical protein [Dehalococcoidia bacterium]